MYARVDHVQKGRNPSSRLFSRSPVGPFVFALDCESEMYEDKDFQGTVDVINKYT